MSTSRRIQIVESFYTGSHRFWADRIQQHSSFEVQLNTLPGRHWKWRLSAGCINLALQAREMPKPDLFLVSSLVDLCGFKALLPRELRDIPVLYYMHENQLVYPERNKLERDRQYGIMQFKSMLAADQIAFNSAFHRDRYFDELKLFLKAFPDRRNTALIPELKDRSFVLHLGIDAPIQRNAKSLKPVVLWNHRWEHDKAPDVFFRVLERVIEQGVDFNVVLCGESFGEVPADFEIFSAKYSDRILHKGYVERTDYEHLLAESSVIPVTSDQEYFGLSVMEAVSYGVIPLLPGRLVYPELYGKHPDLFYKDEDDLVRRLIQILNGTSKPEVPDMGAFYWTERIRDFDACFLSLIKDRP